MINVMMLLVVVVERVVFIFDGGDSVGHADGGVVKRTVLTIIIAVVMTIV